MADLPVAVAREPAAEAAHAFILDAYASRLRREGRGPDHPVAVAAVLAEDGHPATVVVAGLLHDVLEDTDVTADELERAFGAEITRIVAALTQDDAVRDYAARKAALRQSTLEGGPSAVAVALADKVAKLRDSGACPRKRQLRHYRATLDEIEGRYGRSQLGDALRAELARWQ